LPHNQLNSPSFIALFRNPKTQMVCKSSSIWDCNENLKKLKIKKNWIIPFQFVFVSLEN
jgi:hypothetical protein